MTEMIGRLARALNAYATQGKHASHAAKMEAALVAADGMPGLELPKMLVLSTGHLRRPTAQLLEDDEAGVIRHEKGEYGWIIPIIDNPSNDPPPNLIDLVGIYALARSVGATWIMLDRDADIVEGLPSWDW